MGKEEHEALSPSVERESKSDIVDGVVISSSLEKELLDFHRSTLKKLNEQYVADWKTALRTNYGLDTLEGQRCSNEQKIAFSCIDSLSFDSLERIHFDRCSKELYALKACVLSKIYSSK